MKPNQSENESPMAKQQRMERVICDTNIWYYLGSGAIKPQSDILLVASWVNVIELAYAHPLNKKDFSLIDWKNAAEAILNHSREIIQLDPFEFVTDKLFPKCVNFSERKLTDVLQIISAKDDPLKDSIYLRHQKYFEDFARTKDEFVAKLKSVKEGWRQQIKYDQRAKESFKNKQAEYLKIRAADILMDTSEYLKREHDKNIVFDDDDDIKKSLNAALETFDFYATVKQRYLRNLALEKEMTIQPNDFFDLISLLYVGKDDFYWTKEKRWRYLITESGNAGKLLN